MRPPLGPHRKLEEECEKSMAAYCNYCWEVGFPRTQERFSHEMVHYMEYNGIKNKFRKIFPGASQNSTFLLICLQN